MLNLVEGYEAAKVKLASMLGIKGRAAQVERNMLRKKISTDEGLQRARGTDNVPGAFGSGIRHPIDQRPALKPQEMREHARALEARA
jgi:hypothetical protein